MRYPIVAGQFYPENKEELLSSIKSCFLHKLGIGKLPETRNKQVSSLKAVISPHAGYVFSGPCMSHAFNEVAKAQVPEAYVIIGLSHQGFNTCLSDEDFLTPLGTLKNNIAITSMLSTQCKISIDNHPHKQEHSIEVLLPFLQFVKQKEIGKLSIVPLIVGRESVQNIRELGRNLKQALEGKNVIFLVSSDFTHYGIDYDYTPYPKEDIESHDMEAIQMMLKKETEKLYNYNETTGITICGIYPIMALLESISFKHAKLLKYYKSTEIIPSERGSSVSYAAIKFEN